MFSQTAEYALRAMTCLAITPDQMVPTTVLAKQTGIPVNYLAKVLQSLAGAMLITGRRGVGGGYRLAKKPAEIRLIDVLSVIGPLQRSTRPLSIDSAAQPAIESLYSCLDRATTEVTALLSRVTLAEVCASAQPSLNAGSIRPEVRTRPIAAASHNHQHAAHMPGNGTNGAIGLKPAIHARPAGANIAPPRERSDEPLRAIPRARA